MNRKDARPETRLRLRLLLAAVLFALITLPALFRVGIPNARVVPRIYLWAWQRNEDLSFIDPATTGLALWAGTITVEDGRIEVMSRQNPVIFPEGTRQLAVVRLEVDQSYDVELAMQLAQIIQGLVAPLSVDETQIDFDARVSQRDFYQALIAALRKQLPESRLSITALASWCLGDPWIAALPIDAAVPMLYRMGSDGPRIRQHLSEHGHFPATICTDNIGYSTDAPIVPVEGVKRVFLYYPVAWDEAGFAKAYASIAGMMEH